MTASLPPQAPARIPGRRTTDPMQIRMPVALLALALAAAPAAAAPDAAPCPADALGTARVLPVDAATTPRLGRKHFAHTLALAPKEVVLTFDDGPEPGTTAPHPSTRSSANARGRRSFCSGAMRRRTRSSPGAN